jgi:hypothetical protein
VRVSTIEANFRKVFREHTASIHFVRRHSNGRREFRQESRALRSLANFTANSDHYFSVAAAEKLETCRRGGTPGYPGRKRK